MAAGKMTTCAARLAVIERDVMMTARGVRPARAAGPIERVDYGFLNRLRNRPSRQQPIAAITPVLGSGTVATRKPK